MTLTPEPSPLVPVTLSFTAIDLEPGRWQVFRAVTREALSTITESTLDLVSADPTADPADLLGSAGCYTLSRAEVTRVHHGIVRRVEDLGTAAGHRLTRVCLVPALWTLSLRTDTRVFQQLTAVEVVLAVLHDAGLYPGRLLLRLRTSLAPREHCVQHGETDLAFVQRLLEEEGIAWHVEALDGCENLVLADHPGAYGAIPTLDGGPVPVAGPEAATARVETVRRFSWRSSMCTTEVTVRDHDFTRPALDLSSRPQRSGRGPLAGYHATADTVLHGYSAPAYRRDNVQRQADLRTEALAVEAEVALAETVLVGARAGATFTLVGHGRAGLDGRCLVVGAEHHASAPEVLPHAVHGALDGDHTFERYRNTLTCVRAGLPWRPGRKTPRPVVSGVQSATVVGPPGEEIHTDEHGRIRVRFHWDRRTPEGDEGSCWIRVLQPWAGAGWGALFIPRVGMEVVVDFVDGNPDRPVVLGCLYNGQHPPPHALPEHRTRSGLRTRSTPGNEGSEAGNELTFEDASGNEQVYLHAQRDMDLVARRDHTATIHRDHTTVVNRNCTERVAGERTRHVGGTERVTVAAQRYTQVDGDSAETLGGDCERSVVGQETVRVDGGREVTVAVGDALRVTSGGRQVTVDEGGDRLDVAGDKHDSVQGAWDSVTDTRWSVTQGATRVVLEQGHVACVTTGRVQVVADGTEMTMGASEGVLALNAQREIRLTCGAASLVLSSDGTITLRGARAVTMGAGESALSLDHEAATLSGPRVTSQALGLHEIAGALIRIG